MTDASFSFSVAGVGQAPAPARKVWRRRCIWGFAGGLAILLMLVVFRGPLLRGAAHLWIVNDVVDRADLIVALPQVSGKPLPEAARLHREGVAPRVLMPSAPLRPTDKLGLTQPFDAQNRRWMKELGVPEADFQIIGDPAPTAHAAAQVLAVWAQGRSLRSVLVVTELFPTRRVKWAVERALAPLGISVRVVGVPVSDYQVAEWWRSEQGLIHFENEVVLHAFYRLNH
jgi:uncharacterized SAM-binding protein YcdF (DUF218 family)